MEARAWRGCPVCDASSPAAALDAEVCGSACRRERSPLRALLPGREDALATYMRYTEEDFDQPRPPFVLADDGEH